MKNDGVNIILYPRSYNKRGDIGLHSVEGVTQDGNLVNVKLRIDHLSLTGEKIPSIAEFSRTDRKATQACVASENNSPDNREGILLFTHAHLEGKNRKGVPSYVAKWAHVIAADSDAPGPFTGFGRVDFIKESATMETLRNMLISARNLENEFEIDRVTQKMQDPENFQFRLVIYDLKKMFSLRQGDADKFISLTSSFLQSYCDMGISGGFMIRMINTNGYVVEKSWGEFFLNYNFKAHIHESINDFVDRCSRFLSKTHFSDHDFLIQVIPLQCIFMGAADNKYYGDSKQFEVVNETYFSSGQIRVGKVIASCMRDVGADKLSCSRVHLLGNIFFEPFRLDKHGATSLPVEGENKTYAQGYVRDNDLIEMPVGYFQSRFISRDFWMFNDNDFKIDSFINSFEVSIESSSFERGSKGVSPETPGLSNEIENQNNIVVPTEESEDDFVIVESPEGEQLTGLAAFIRRKNL